MIIWTLDFMPTDPFSQGEGKNLYCLVNVLFVVIKEMDFKR